MRPGSVSASRAVIIARIIRCLPLLFAGIAPGVPFPASAQVSPGPLSRPHADLDGPLECLKCHGTGAETLRKRCLNCHREISWLAANERGLHGHTRVDGCAECHTEHAGLTTPLVRFEEGSPERFDHARTGWPLAGKHASVKCGDCHKPELQSSEVLRLSPRKDHRSTFLGLERDCAACHEDVHRGALGRDCRQCHIATSWRSVPAFDHARTAYPLTGKHVTVECNKCHRTSGGVRPVFKPLSHGECSDCHTDPHQGRAGPSCSRCHVTDSFRRLATRSFDHARTGYPLEGKHLQASCEGCHRPNRLDSRAPMVLRPRHARCTDCHADGHGGQLAGREDRGECASCHTVEGWKPSTYTAQQHAALRLDLRGRHRTIECAACHGPESKGPAAAFPAERAGSARVVLALGNPPCSSCHFDPHHGRFAAGGERAKERDCLACHSLDVFRPSTVDTATHREFGFPVEGAHRTVRCDGCHKEMPPPAVESSPRSASSRATSLLFTADRTCEACHRKTPHGDQFARRRDGGACGSCHGDESFRTAARFDHDRDSRFPLLRSHGQVACARCHDQTRDESGQMTVLYRPVSFDCKGCHSRTAPWLSGRGGRSAASAAGARKRPKR